MGYYYICWRKQGQTLGMKAWRLGKLHNVFAQQLDGSLVHLRHAVPKTLSTGTFIINHFRFGLLLLLDATQKIMRP